MKKTVLILFILLFIIGCAKKSETTYEKNYQFPNIPMGSSKQQVLDIINAQGEFKNLATEEALIIIENYPFYDIRAKKIKFYFLNDKLQSIRVKFPNSENEKLKNTILATYGKPVSSFRRALFPYMMLPQPILIPELLDIDIVKENVNEVWHPEKPISELWTQDEKETFQKEWDESLRITNRHLREDPALWQTLFENNWENFFTVYWSDSDNTDSTVMYEAVLKNQFTDFKK